MTETKNTRNSPRRILEIIEAICINPEAATATRLSQSLEIPAPTIYRWLDALSEERFIAPTASGHYVPGERFRDLILNSLQYEPKVTERRSLLRSLSKQLNETVNLSIPHGTKLIYFDRLEFSLALSGQPEGRRPPSAPLLRIRKALSGNARTKGRIGRV